MSALTPTMFLLSFGSHSALYALVTSQAWALPDDLSARQSRRAGAVGHPHTQG